MIMEVDMSGRWVVDLVMVMTGLMVVMVDAHLVAMVNILIVLVDYFFVFCFLLLL